MPIAVDSVRRVSMVELAVDRFIQTQIEHKIQYYNSSISELLNHFPVRFLCNQITIF